MERVCKVLHEYAGRQIKVGERFEVEPAHLDLMVAMGRIEREPGDKVPGYVAPSEAGTWPNTYSTRAMSAKPARGQRRTKAN